MYSPLIQELIEALRCLPGVGPKSAQRMALHILERAPDSGLTLADSLKTAIDGVGQCSRCRTLTELDVCQLCTHPNRNDGILCIVETPADVFALEHTGEYKGRYFVLMGRLSPLDGMGPKEIGIDQLKARLSEGTVKEVILATNPTVEGDATAYYIAQACAAFDLTCTRIAHGVPIGGELEYLDGGTLTRAMTARVVITTEKTAETCE